MGPTAIPRGKPVSLGHRVVAVDVARGLAGLIMIQGHAFDGWASPAAKETTAYAWTRFLGSFPLPAFLVLAGAAIALRVDIGVKRSEDATTVRTRIVTRGLQVVVYGYATNFAYAVLDGWDSLATLLRADVLHCIGLSIALIATLGVTATGPTGRLSRRRLAIAAATIGLASTAACPWVTRATRRLDADALGFVVGLFADVPRVTDMPVIPLIAWVSAGVLAGQVMLWAREGALASSSGRDIPRSFAVGLGLVGALVAIAANYGTSLTVRYLDEPLSRESPAVWFNVLDLAGRGVVVLAFGTALGTFVSGWLLSILLRLGRGSLIAYVFHIPFCYGTLGQTMRGQLTMTEATAGVVLLSALSLAAVWARDAVRHRWRGSP